MNESVGRNERRIEGNPGYAAFEVPTDLARRVCLISRTPACELGLPEGLSLEGMPVEQTEDLAAAVRHLASRRSGYRLVLVNFDDFSGESIVFDLLRRLRTRSPNLPVILLSRSFRADDLTQERLAIADVSLVAPIADTSLIGPALVAAAANNAAWRKRRRGMMLERARQMN